MQQVEQIFFPLSIYHGESRPIIKWQYRKSCSFLLKAEHKLAKLLMQGVFQTVA